MPERLVLIVRNPALAARVRRVAAAAGLEVEALAAPTDLGGLADRGDLSERGPPTAVVLELELPGAIESVAAAKRRWPATFLAGSVTLPDQELWLAARAAGCDLVLNHGALPARLRRRLAERAEGRALVPEPLRLAAKPVACAGDGLVGRAPDAPDGPIAVFSIGGALCAIRDVCPHAGASLADGELEGTVVTCPLHGSRFDVRTGRRLRGPADYPIRVYRAFREGDALWVEVPSDA